MCSDELLLGDRLNLPFEENFLLAEKGPFVDFETLYDFPNIKPLRYVLGDLHKHVHTRCFWGRYVSHTHVHPEHTYTRTQFNWFSHVHTLTCAHIHTRPHSHEPTSSVTNVTEFFVL